HRHRVAARRTRAFLRTARKHLDPGWRRPLNEALKQLGEATGPVRDLDVALAHLRPELEGLDETDQHAKALLLERLEEELERHRRGLLEALDSHEYRYVLSRLRFPPRLAVAVEDVRTAAAFAAGRLAERQHVRRERVRERLPAAWKRLRKSGSRLI